MIDPARLLIVSEDMGEQEVGDEQGGRERKRVLRFNASHPKCGHDIEGYAVIPLDRVGTPWQYEEIERVRASIVEVQNDTGPCCLCEAEQAQLTNGTES